MLAVFSRPVIVIRIFVFCVTMLVAVLLAVEFMPRTWRYTLNGGGVTIEANRIVVKGTDTTFSIVEAAQLLPTDGLPVKSSVDYGVGVSGMISTGKTLPWDRFWERLRKTHDPVPPYGALSCNLEPARRAGLFDTDFGKRFVEERLDPWLRDPNGVLAYDVASSGAPETHELISTAGRLSFFANWGSLLGTVAGTREKAYQNLRKQAAWNRQKYCPVDKHGSGCCGAVERDAFQTVFPICDNGEFRIEGDRVQHRTPAECIDRSALAIANIAESDLDQQTVRTNVAFGETPNLYLFVNDVFVTGELLDGMVHCIGSSPDDEAGGMSETSDNKCSRLGNGADALLTEFCVDRELNQYECENSTDSVAASIQRAALWYRDNHGRFTVVLSPRESQ